MLPLVVNVNVQSAFLNKTLTFHISMKRSTMENMEQWFDNRSPTVQWSPVDVTWGMTVFVGWMAVVLLAGELSGFAGLNIDPGMIVVFGTVLLLVPAWYFTIHKYGATWADLGLRGFQPSSIGMGCGLMLASLLFNMVYATFLGLFGLQIQPDISLIFNQTDYPLLLLFGGAVIAPVVEEIFFRGFIFAGLKQRWHWPIAGAVSALLFAIAHIVPTSFLPIFILGFIFSFLYHISGSIWPAILMHMLTNTLALSAAYAISQGWTPPG
jgi:membrane protease YdiL (CAAX protease family)